MSEHYEVMLSYDGFVWIEVDADSPEEARKAAKAIAAVGDLQCGEWRVEAQHVYLTGGVVQDVLA